MTRVPVPRYPLLCDLPRSRLTLPFPRPQSNDSTHGDPSDGKGRREVDLSPNRPGGRVLTQESRGVGADIPHRWRGVRVLKRKKR